MKGVRLAGRGGIWGGEGGGGGGGRGGGGGERAAAKEEKREMNERRGQGANERKKRPRKICLFNSGENKIGI